MVDNVQITAGSGTTIAADSITDGGVANGALAQRVKIGVGADNNYKDVEAGAPLPSYTPGGLVSIASTPFNRPANTTPYTAGDLVADNVTAGSVTATVFPTAVRVAGERIRVERIRLRKSGPSLTNASFRVYLCRALPTLAVGDNGVLNAAGVLAIDDVVHVIAWFDITMDRSATAGARGVGIPNAGGSVTIEPSTGTSLFAMIEATAAYTPVSGETFNVTLEGQWS